MNRDTKYVRIAVDGRDTTPEPFEVRVADGRLFLKLGVNATMDMVTVVNKATKKNHELDKGFEEDVGGVQNPEGFAKTTPEQVTGLLQKAFWFESPPQPKAVRYIGWKPT